VFPQDTKAAEGGERGTPARKQGLLGTAGAIHEESLDPVPERTRRGRRNGDRRRRFAPGLLVRLELFRRALGGRRVPVDPKRMGHRCPGP